MHVLLDPREGRELVLHAVDLDGRDRGARQRRQEHAPERVPQRHAEAALEGLDRELAVAVVFEDFSSTSTFLGI